MSIRNLDVTLEPGSVALIGATERPGAVGRVVLENITGSGFQGRIFAVNPKYDDVLGRRCYRAISDLPEAPDIAVVMTPAPTLPGVISELGAKGVKAAVVLSAGATAASGIRQAVLDAARPHGLRIIGPNTIGLLAPRVALNASFVHLAPNRGRLGLISQSGAMVSSIVDWAAAEGIGCSQIYSLGDMADVDIGDCLNVLAADGETSAILMYLESITDARKFMSAARAASRLKPVIAVKPGRHAEAARAAATHTGALAGTDRVVDAALRRAGIIRVDDLGDLFTAAEITSRYRPLSRGRVAIITNGGGAGVLAVDKLLDDGASLAELSQVTIAALDAALPSTWSRANPVDIIGDAPPERYRDALRAVASDPGVDAILVMNCPTALADPSDAARGVAGETDHGTVAGKPVLTCWLGRKAAAPARAILRDAGIGEFETPAEAAAATALLTRWSSLRAELQRVPPEQPPPAVHSAAVASILRAVAAEGRALLTEDEAKAVIGAFGIPVSETILARTEADVEVAASHLLETERAVVVKVRSRSISHKSDVGGVVLDLTTGAAARQAAVDIRRRVSLASPPLPIDGFTVQPMIDGGGQELIVGLSTDPTFGPVLLFGQGGTAVEVLDDTAMALPPLDEVLAADVITRTRVSRLLAGYRDVPPADHAAIVRALLAVSQLAVDFPMIVSIDVNPLIASSAGVIALDARIAIDPSLAPLGAPNPALAIHPYPADAESQVILSGNQYLIRPIRPSDASLYPTFLARVTAEDMRLRFLVPTRLTEDTLIRLTQLDYDREIAFLAIDQGTGELSGIVRYAADPDRGTAEFGILVRSDLKGRGIGYALLDVLIGYARSQHIGQLFGRVLRENQTMLTLCVEHGFVATTEPGDPSLIRMTLKLGPHSQ